MKEWATHLLENYSRIFLGGWHIGQEEEWQHMLAGFWEKFKDIEPSHPVFASGYDTKFLIPYAFHGDEGRGYCHVPFMVVSWQPVISHRGMQECNDSSHLVRFMRACLGSIHTCDSEALFHD